MRRIHLDLHCLHRYLFSSAELKGLPIYPWWALLCLSLDRSISHLRGIYFGFSLSFIVENPVFNGNRVDPDPTRSDLSLHCFPLPLLWDARHKYVKSK